MAKLSFSWIGNFLFFAFLLVSGIYLVGDVTLSAAIKLELAYNGEKTEGIVYDHRRQYRTSGGGFRDERVHKQNTREFRRIFGARALRGNPVVHRHRVRRPSDNAKEARIVLDKKYPDSTVLPITCRSAVSTECIQGTLEEGVLKFLDLSISSGDRVNLFCGLGLLLYAMFRYSELRTIKPEA